MKAIFEDGIASRKATFDREAPSWQEWDGAPFSGTRLRGYATLSLAVPRRRQRGGRSYRWLIADAEAEGYYSIHAGVFPWNEESLSLHERLGFRVVGVHERLRLLDGEWKDVVGLERRSA